MAMLAASFWRLTGPYRLSGAKHMTYGTALKISLDASVTRASREESSTGMLAHGGGTSGLTRGASLRSNYP